MRKLLKVGGQWILIRGEEGVGIAEVEEHNLDLTVTGEWAPHYTRGHSQGSRRSSLGGGVATDRYDEVFVIDDGSRERREEEEREDEN